MAQVVVGKIKWTYDLLKKEAAKYISKIEFQRKSKGAYLAAFRKNILNNICEHMERPLNHNKIWFKENCRTEALKYKTRTKFFNDSKGAYKAAKREGWLDEICSHMEINHDIYKRCVYAYEFPDNHVYVGITCNIERRKLEHMKLSKSPVLRYIEKTKLQPKFVLLNDYVDVFLA